ncbi:MAG: type IX secretion system membrane protein PorP/SprF [Flavobacteriales bacterium]|nr:type IX secretion system membrane protein PorP/SprF [Flavobacteriales bacterium]
MKRILLISLSLFCLSELSAQQDPQFTQNMFNRLAVNPAYAGSNGSICGTLLTREQWMGFEGNPRTTVFSADGAFKIAQQYQFGAGLTVIQDEIGPIQTTNAKLGLSYHLRIKQGILALGFDAGIANQSITAKWRTSSGNFDGTEDAAIPNSDAGGYKFDLGGGIYYYTKELYVGLSSTHLNQPLINGKGSGDDKYVFKQVRHYYVMAGYDYELNSMFTLQPSIFTKTDAISTQVDINANVLYNDLIWAGLSYRLNDAVAFLAGVNVPRFEGLRVGMAYDYNISALSDYNDGSLEFMINYCYKIVRKEKIQRYKSVRFL